MLLFGIFFFFYPVCHKVDSGTKPHFNILFSLTYMYAGESGVDLDVLSTGTGNFQIAGELVFHFNGMLSPRYYNNSKQRFHNRLPTRTSIPHCPDTAASDCSEQASHLPLPLTPKPPICKTGLQGTSFKPSCPLKQYEDSIVLTQQ